MVIKAQQILTIDDLPRFSEWPARLLGLAEWQQRKKTPAEVTREFDSDKWGALLRRYRAQGRPATLEEVEGWSLEGLPPTLCSIGKRFELLSPMEARARHLATVADALERHLPGAALVELGAGFGSVILKLAMDPRFQNLPMYAAEYTSSGVELMGELSQSQQVRVSIGRCDLSQDRLTDLLVPGSSIVFTCMAVHYIAEISSGFIDAFLQMKPKVVVHFEPCYEHCSTDTLTGALRRRYIEVNDYNRNLVSVLHDAAQSRRIRILQETPVAIGVNPLLPISVLAWCPEG